MPADNMHLPPGAVNFQFRGDADGDGNAGFEDSREKGCPGGYFRASHGGCARDRGGCGPGQPARERGEVGNLTGLNGFNSM